MEDIEMEINNYKPEISTLVFMDLESTGLPSDIGKKNVNITEMSLVAIDRSSFEEDKDLRIVNKISLCVRPRSVISPFSMNITGLYNDILETQEEFDDSVPKLLEYFFRRLKKPICLLAHNGYKFDFPLLKAELNRVNYTLGPDLVCVDTLVAFRSISKLKKETEEFKLQHKDEKSLPTHSKSCKDIAISDDDIDSILSKDLESFSSIDVFIPSKEEKYLGSEILPSENKSTVEEKTNYETCEFLSPILNEQTPKKQKVAFDGHETIQIKRKKKILDPTYTPQLEYKKRRPAKRNILAKRALFTEYDSSSFNIHKITSFSLQSLYNHFFNEPPPNSHYAEVDTICLSKVCQKIHKDFLQWIDKNSVSFSTINALW